MRYPFAVAASIAILGAAILAVSLACDSGHDIKYVNKTDSTLQLFIDDGFVLTLAPREERKSGILRFFEPKRFQARDGNGQIVFSEVLTWAELEERDFRILFAERILPEQSPTPLSR